MDNYLEIAGTCVGLIYLWLEYKASIYLWTRRLKSSVALVF